MLCHLFTAGQELARPFGVVFETRGESIQAFGGKQAGRLVFIVARFVGCVLGAI
jgi:hypothetical protein